MKNYHSSKIFFALCFSLIFFAGCLWAQEEPQNQTGSLNITTIPQGAEVYINSEYAGISPLFLEGIEPGDYGIDAEIEGYIASSGNYSVEAGQATDVAFILEQMPFEGDENESLAEPEQLENESLAEPEQPGETAGSLEIISYPESARIYLDGEEKGITPKILDKVPPGIHNVLIILQSHSEYETGAEIFPGEKTTVEAYLEPIQAAESSLPPTSEIGFIAYLPGKVNQHKPKGSIWQGDADGKSGSSIPPLYYCQKWFLKTIAISDAGEEFISGRTSPGRPEAREEGFGHVFACLIPENESAAQISITSNPTGAQAYLDQKYLGQTPFIAGLVPSGPHIVRISKQGFSDHLEEVEVFPGGIFYVEAELLPLQENPLIIRLRANRISKFTYPGDFPEISPEDFVSGLSGGKAIVRIKDRENRVYSPDYKYNEIPLIIPNQSYSIRARQDVALDLSELLQIKAQNKANPAPGQPSVLEQFFKNATASGQEPAQGRQANPGYSNAYRAISSYLEDFSDWLYEFLSG